MHTSRSDRSGHWRRARPSRLLSAAAAVLAAAACGLGAVGPAGASVSPVAPRQVTTRPHAPLTAFPAPGVRPAVSEVINLNSAKCLGTSFGADNIEAVQWDCNGAPNQQWHWGSENPNHPGYYQLINGNDGGNDQCLGISAGSTKEGADAVGWTCLGPSHLDQYWAKFYGPSGCPSYVWLQNLYTGYALGVAGNSTANGANVVQWAYQTKCNNQLWYGL
jgi:hypothetical protein